MEIGDNQEVKYFYNDDGLPTLAMAYYKDELQSVEEYSFNDDDKVKALIVKHEDENVYNREYFFHYNGNKQLDSVATRFEKNGKIIRYSTRIYSHKDGRINGLRTHYAHPDSFDLVTKFTNLNKGNYKKEEIYQDRRGDQLLIETTEYAYTDKHQKLSISELSIPNFAHHVSDDFMAEYTVRDANGQLVVKAEYNCESDKKLVSSCTVLLERGSGKLETNDNTYTYDCD